MIDKYLNIYFGLGYDHVYTNDNVCKFSFLVPFCTFLLLTRMMMSMNINVGHDNVVYMTP